MFSGKIAYGALFNVQSRLAHVERVCFWPLVDIIGLSLYVPLSTNDNAPLHELNRTWLNHSFGDIQKSALSATVSRPPASSRSSIPSADTRRNGSLASVSGRCFLPSSTRRIRARGDTARAI